LHVRLRDRVARGRTLIEPSTRRSDSRQHDYLLALEPASGERAIAVRVTDAAENFSVAKIVAR